MREITKSVYVDEIRNRERTAQALFSPGVEICKRLSEYMDTCRRFTAHTGPIAALPRE